MNDIVIIFKFAKILIYADIKLFKQIMPLTDCQLLQADLRALQLWCSKNNLEVNISKCSVISFNRKRTIHLHSYYYSEVVLDRDGEVRDLGAIFSTYLSFRSHIEILVKKAYMFRIY